MSVAPWLSSMFLLNTMQYLCFSSVLVSTVSSGMHSNARAYGVIQRDVWSKTGDALDGAKSIYLGVSNTLPTRMHID